MTKPTSRRFRLLMWTIVIGVLLLIGWSLLPHPLYYEQDAIEARVIDKESGRPLQGVPVLAVWYVETGAFEVMVSIYRYEEAVTDANGRFRLSPWKRWRKRDEGHLKDEDPIIRIYQPGYKSVHLTNRDAYVPVVGLPGPSGRNEWRPQYPPQPGQQPEKYPGWRWTGAKRHAYWNDATIEMERAMTLKEQAQALNIGYGFYGEDIVAPHFWAKIAEGWSSLPPSARTHQSPPTQVLRIKEQVSK